MHTARVACIQEAEGTLTDVPGVHLIGRPQHLEVDVLAGAMKPHGRDVQQTSRSRSRSRSSRLVVAVALAVAVAVAVAAGGGGGVGVGVVVVVVVVVVVLVGE